jgi:hypothetical protein
MRLVPIRALDCAHRLKLPHVCDSPPATPSAESIRPEPASSITLWPLIISMTAKAAAGAALMPVFHALAVSDTAILGLGAFCEASRGRHSRGATNMLTRSPTPSHGTSPHLTETPEPASRMRTSLNPWPRSALMLRWGHLLGIPALLLSCLSAASGWPASVAAQASGSQAQQAAAAAGSAGILYMSTLLLAPLIVAIAYTSSKEQPTPASAVSPHHQEHNTRPLWRRLTTHANTTALIQTAAAASWLAHLSAFCFSTLPAPHGPGWLTHLLADPSLWRSASTTTITHSIAQHGAVADVSFAAALAWTCKVAAGVCDWLVPALVCGTCLASAGMWCCYWAGALAQAGTG